MSGSRLCRRGALACALAAAYAHAAQAQAPVPPANAGSPALLVRTVPCEQARYDADVLVRLLTVELGALGVDVEPLAKLDEASTSGRVANAPALVTIECGAAPGALVIRLADMATRKELTRGTQIDDVPEEARPRALALAVVALVESSWSEAVGMEGGAGAELPPTVRARVEERLAHRLAASEEAPSTPPPVYAATTSHGPSFDVSANLRVFPGRGTGLIGIRASALPLITPSLRLALDLEALWGTSELADSAGSIGSMDLYWLNAGTGLAWRVGGTPLLEVGPRVQLGYAYADAHVDRSGADAKNEGSLVLSTLAAAALHAGPPDGPWASIGFDLGYTPVGIVFLGDQARLSGMADTTFALRLGVAW